MLSHELRSPTPQNQVELLRTYQVSREFYQEVQYRQNFERHCQWYQQTAALHRQEVQKMQQDINILGWFRRNPSNRH